METQSTRAECASKPSPALRGRALIDAWVRSGLSQVAYARQQHIAPHLLSYWKRRLRKVESSTAAAASSEPALTDFVQIRTPMPSHPPSIISEGGSPVELLLACGVVVRVTSGVDPVLLRLVVTTLVGERC